MCPIPKATCTFSFLYKVSNSSATFGEATEEEDQSERVVVREMISVMWVSDSWVEEEQREQVQVKPQIEERMFWRCWWGCRMFMSGVC